jgi:hypothetical protein
VDLFFVAYGIAVTKSYFSLLCFVTHDCSVNGRQKSSNISILNAPTYSEASDSVCLPIGQTTRTGTGTGTGTHVFAYRCCTLQDLCRSPPCQSIFRCSHTNAIQSAGGRHKDLHCSGCSG